MQKLCYPRTVKHIKKYWQIIFPILVMILIWNFSAQNGEDSDNISLGFAAKLGLPNGVVRKIAHFTIYAVLGAMLINFFRSIKHRKIIGFKYTIISLAIAATYSCIDEFHQSFIPERDGNPLDIVIDSLGACAGIAIYIAIYSFIKSKHKK